MTTTTTATKAVASQAALVSAALDAALELRAALRRLEDAAKGTADEASFIRLGAHTMVIYDSLTAAHT